MSLHITRSPRKLSKPSKLYKPLIATLAILALFITAFPSLAATPQPQSTHPPQTPNATCPPDGQCFADVPASNRFYVSINRIYMQDLVSGYPCGGPNEPCDPQSRPYYRPNNTVNRAQMAKFVDNARHLPGIEISGSDATLPISVTNDTGYAIYAQSTDGYGVYASSTTGYGVFGYSQSYVGVRGSSTTGYGVWGYSSDSYGVRGYSTNGYGVYASSTNNWAGYFDGNIFVSGNCVGCVGPYKIDDPLDPSNKYLYQSAVASPDMMNIYNGNVTTDDKGNATIQLPDYFQALNRDFRYQLTIMGDQFAQARVSSEIKDNSFTIKTDKPNIKVSWQVTGIRQDPYANAHRIPVEQDKPANEKGKYLHPTELGQPASLGVDYEEQQRMQEVPQSKP